MEIDPPRHMNDQMLPTPRNIQRTRSPAPSYESHRMDYQMSYQPMPSYHEPPPYAAERRHSDYTPRQHENAYNYHSPTPQTPGGYSEPSIRSPGPTRADIFPPRHRSQPYTASRPRHDYTTAPNARTYASSESLPPFNYVPPSAPFSPPVDRSYPASRERQNGMEWQTHQFQPPPPPPTGSSNGNGSNDSYFPPSGGAYNGYNEGYRGGPGG